MCCYTFSLSLIFSHCLFSHTHTHSFTLFLTHLLSHSLSLYRSLYSLFIIIIERWIYTDFILFYHQINYAILIHSDLVFSFSILRYECLARTYFIILFIIIQRYTSSILNVFKRIRSICKPLEKAQYGSIQIYIIVAKCVYRY